MDKLLAELEAAVRSLPRLWDRFAPRLQAEADSATNSDEEIGRAVRLRDLINEFDAAADDLLDEFKS